MIVLVSPIVARAIASASSSFACAASKSPWRFEDRRLRAQRLEQARMIRRQGCAQPGLDLLGFAARGGDVAEIKVDERQRAPRLGDREHIRRLRAFAQIERAQQQRLRRGGAAAFVLGSAELLQRARNPFGLGLCVAFAQFERAPERIAAVLDAIEIVIRAAERFLDIGAHQRAVALARVGQRQRLFEQRDGRLRITERNVELPERSQQLRAQARLLGQVVFHAPAAELDELARAERFAQRILRRGRVEHRQQEIARRLGALRLLERMLALDREAPDERGRQCSDQQRD